MNNYALDTLERQLHICKSLVNDHPNTEAFKNDLNDIRNALKLLYTELEF